MSSTETLQGAALLPILTPPVFILLLPALDQLRRTVARVLTRQTPGPLELALPRPLVVGLPERATVLTLGGLAALGGFAGFVVDSAIGYAVVLGLLGLLSVAFARARVRLFHPVLGGPAAPGAVTHLDITLADVRRVLAMIVDACLVAVTFYIAYRWHYGSQFNIQFDAFLQALPVVLAVQMVTFFAIGLYRDVWRTFGHRDVLTLGAGVVLGTLVAMALTTALSGAAPGAAPVWAIDAGLLFVLVFASRPSFAQWHATVRRTAQIALVVAAVLGRLGDITESCV